MCRLPFLLLGLVPAAAWAAGRGETAFGAGPALAVVRQGETRVGAAVDARVLYGLNDVWSAHAGLTLAWLPASDATPATLLTAPAVGLTAAADIVNWVPFVQAGLALADVRRDGGSQQRLGAQLGVGADYLISRHMTLTVLGRIDHFALAVAGAGGPTPVQLVLTLQLGHVF
jgi:hypothetical protein